MLVTLMGMVTLIRGSPTNPLNAETPMLVTPLPRVMLVRLEHPENAKSPMLVTLLGIVTLVSLEHLTNAPSPMLVTPLPRVKCCPG